MNMNADKNHFFNDKGNMVLMTTVTVMMTWYPQLPH